MNYVLAAVCGGKINPVGCCTKPFAVCAIHGNCRYCFGFKKVLKVTFQLNKNFLKIGSVRENIFRRIKNLYTFICSNPDLSIMIFSNAQNIYACKGTGCIGFSKYAGSVVRTISERFILTKY